MAFENQIRVDQHFIRARLLDDGETVEARLFLTPELAEGGAVTDGWSVSVDDSPVVISAGEFDEDEPLVRLTIPATFGVRSLTISYDPEAGSTTGGGFPLRAVTDRPVANFSAHGIVATASTDGAAAVFDAVATPVLVAAAETDGAAGVFDATATVEDEFWFDALPNIRDFGIRNLANMRTVAGGGTLPVNNGDTVGEWRGELGNVVLRESSSTWRPELGAEGVSFQAASGTKRLRSSSGISRSATLAVTVFVIEDLGASGYSDFVSPNMRTSGVIQHGFTDANSGTSVQTSCRAQSAGVTVPSGSLNSGRHCHAYVFDGAACNVWSDSTKTNRPSIGTGSGTSDIFELTNTGAQDGTVVAWGVIYGAISDTDWAKIVALAPTL